MKKLKKRITILLIALSIICMKSNVLAMSAQNIKEQGDDWINKGEQTTPPITTSEAFNLLLPVGQLLVGIASVVLVICYMWLGIKYMTTDPSGKADIKQKLIGLVIATVLIYGGVGIFAIIVNLMNSILA